MGDMRPLLLEAAIAPSVNGDPHPMIIESERATFEAYTREHWPESVHTLERNGEGYRSFMLNTAWQGWMAHASNTQRFAQETAIEIVRSYAMNISSLTDFERGRKVATDTLLRRMTGEMQIAGEPNMPSLPDPDTVFCEILAAVIEPTMPDTAKFLRSGRVGTYNTSVLTIYHALEAMRRVAALNP